MGEIGVAELVLRRGADGAVVGERAALRDVAAVSEVAVLVGATVRDEVGGALGVSGNHVDGVSGIEVMIAAERRTVHVNNVTDVGDVVEAGAGGGGAGGVGQGHETAEPHGPGVEAGGGDLIIRKREAGKRVPNVPDAGKVTGLHSGGGVREEGRGGLPLAEPFVGAEEERFITDDGAATAQAEFVAVEGRALLAIGVIKVCVGGEFAIAIECEQGAVELVGAALRDDRDSGGAFVLGLGVVGFDFKFLDRVNGGGRRERGAEGVGRAAVAGIVNGDAVD